MAKSAFNLANCAHAWPAQEREGARQVNKLRAYQTN